MMSTVAFIDLIWSHAHEMQWEVNKTWSTPTSLNSLFDPASSYLKNDWKEAMLNNTNSQNADKLIK